MRLARPPIGAVFNRAHPLARSLKLAWLVNEGGGRQLYDLGTFGVHATTTASSTRWIGDIFRFGADQFNTVSTIRLTPQADEPGWTVVARLAMEGSSYSSQTALNCETRWRLMVGETGDTTRVSARWGGTWGTRLGGGPVLQPRVPFDVALRWHRGLNTVDLFHNGVIVQSASQGAPSTAAQRLNFGHGSDAGLGNWTGLILHVYVYNVAISTDAIRELLANPYGMFQTAERRKGPRVLYILPPGVPSAEAFGSHVLTIKKQLPPIRVALGPTKARAEVASTSALLHLDPTRASVTPLATGTLIDLAPTKTKAES